MTLEELTTPLTRKDVEKNIYAVLQAKGISTTSWIVGSVVRAIVTGVAIMLSAITYLIAAIARMGFLATSEVSWLTIKAKEDFDVERIGATFAQGDVVLTNSAGGVHSLGVGDLIVKSSVTNKTYRNTEAFTLAANGSATIAVEAVEAGPDSTAPTGTINLLETVLNGVAVSNPATLVGAAEENDEQLRNRCLAKRTSFGTNGAKGAYRFAALSATLPDGSPAGATRVALDASGDGEIDVYVATGSGGLTGTEGNESTPLGAVRALLDKSVVPQGISIQVLPAGALPVDITCALWVKPGQSVGVAAKIKNELAKFVGEHPIGGTKKTSNVGYVFADALQAFIARQVSGLVDVELTVPGSDILVAKNKAPVLGAVAITVVETI